MNTKKINQILFNAIVLATVVSAVTLVSGCRRAKSTKVEVNQSASVGQQLQDLDASYQKGIITQKEYEDLKRAIIKKNE